MKKYKKSFFIRFSNAVADRAGQPAAFCGAALLVIVWACLGPAFGFSETWQLVINTSTTIITFLMVFVIQSTQNRDAYAVQLKLDEIIRSIKGAHTELLDIEELPEERLKALRDLYEDLARQEREKIRKGGDDTDTPAIKLPAFDD